MDTTELRTAITALIPHAESWLKQQYGTIESFLHGFGYHNYDHSRDVSSAVEQIMNKLVEVRYVQPETVPLAQYAAWWHDGKQGKDHERYSAQIAAASMRTRNIPEHRIATVVKMIDATKLLRIDIETARIVQAANPDDPEEAALADADLAHLGRPGVYPALLLSIEQQHRNGLITLPSPTDGTDVEPNREATIEFLQFQFRLHDQHQFMLKVSRRLFPHQEANRDEIGRMLEDYTADRISFSEMLIDAKRCMMN